MAETLVSSCRQRLMLLVLLLLSGGGVEGGVGAAGVNVEHPVGS
jgi:hypothetical protein